MRQYELQESPAGKNCFPQCKLEDWVDNMVGCDNDSCPVQWFHYGCVGLTEVILPKGKLLRPLFCPSGTMGQDVK